MRPLTRYHLAIALFLFVATAIVNAQTSDRPRNEIEVRGVLSIPSGEASFSANGAAGSVISFSRDFDFRKELGFELRYTYRTDNGKHKLQAGYSQTTWNRNTVLSRSFTFRGETFDANLSAHGDLRLSNFRAMYAYRWGNERFRIGPMADMGVVSTRLNINATTNNGSRSGSGSIAKFAASVGYDPTRYWLRLSLQPLLVHTRFNRLRHEISATPLRSPDFVIGKTDDLSDSHIHLLDLLGDSRSSDRRTPATQTVHGG